MSSLRRLMRWPWRRHDASLAEEIDHHRALMQGDLERQGLTPAEAAATSRRAMGNVTLAREESRDVWVVAWVDRIWRDAKHGIRGLRREPTFTLTTVLTLALGVTATTAVFSVVDAELWRPLPFPRPQQLVSIRLQNPADPSARGVSPMSGSDLSDWRSGAPALAGLAAMGDSTRVVLQRDTAESLQVDEVTPNYFAMLGRAPIVGRTFSDTAGGPREAILTDRAWRRVFSADPSVVGRSFAIDGQATSIVGIVTADDALGPDPDLYLAVDDRAAAGTTPRTFFGAIGRLQPGASPEAARAQLQAIVTREAVATGTARGRTILIEDLREYFRRSNWRPLAFFLGASLVVLVLSAVNAASLLLARASKRGREFALRGALGGGGRALARQLVVEGALLAVPAGALGLVLARWAVQAITSALPVDFLQHADVPVDIRAALFALGVTMVTTVIFALAPLTFTRRLNLSSALGQGERAGQSGASGRARRALLAAQIALTMVLLFGAGIFVKSFSALVHVPLGFDPNNAVALRVSLSGTRYSSDAAIRDYADQLLTGARAVPGVEHAAIGSSSPLGSGPLVRFVVRDEPRPAPGREPHGILRAATPEYFRTLGIHLVRGREFTTDDQATAPIVAIVNETLVRQVFGADNPLGRVLDIVATSARWARRADSVVIVGVVSNVKEIELNETEIADVYVPFAQVPAPWVELVARSGGSAGVVGALHERMASLDPSMPVTSFTTFDDRLARALQGDRFNLILIASFAGLAVVLAAIGIYGALAYHVQTRTREFGVRLALGAQPARLVTGSLWQAARLGIAGGAMGLGGTLVLAAVLGNALYLVPGAHEGLLYGVTTTDPVVLGSAYVAIVAVAIAAGVVPARRVARIDPLLALRNE